MSNEIAEQLESLVSEDAFKFVNLLLVDDKIVSKNELEEQLIEMLNFFWIVPNIDDALDILEDEPVNIVFINFTLDRADALYEHIVHGEKQFPVIGIESGKHDTIKMHIPKPYNTTQIVNKINSVISEIPFDKPDAIEEITIGKAIEDFFQSIMKRVARCDQSKSNKTMDYEIMSEFINTAFNNLSVIDNSMTMNSDIIDAKEAMSEIIKVKGIFARKTSQGMENLFENIFLNRMPTYARLKSTMLENLDIQRRCSVEIPVMEEKMKSIKEEIGKLNETDTKFKELDKEYRTFNGKYVDSVHHINEAKEKISECSARMKEIADDNREMFTKNFHDQKDDIEQHLTVVLNKSTYLFDRILWRAANESTKICNYFDQGMIMGVRSSKIYLKYHVRGLLSDMKSGKSGKSLSPRSSKLIKYLQEYDKVNRKNIAMISADNTNAKSWKTIIEEADGVLKVFASSQAAQVIQLHEKFNFEALVIDSILHKTTIFQILKAFSQVYPNAFDNLVICHLISANTPSLIKKKLMESDQDIILLERENFHDSMSSFLKLF